MSIEIFECGLDKWPEKLAQDEWYFRHLIEQVTQGVTAEQAFILINNAIMLLLRQQDTFVAYACFNLVFALVERANTTELPTQLAEMWDELAIHMAKLGLNHELDEIKRWYRISIECVRTTSA